MLYMPFNNFAVEYVSELANNNFIIDLASLLQQIIIISGQRMKSVKKTASQSKQTKCGIKTSIMDNQTECPICLQDYDLLKKVPMMICFNQHSTCAKCMPIVYNKHKCPVCCQKLVNKSDVKKNRLVCCMLQQIFRGNGQILIYGNNFTYKGQSKNGKRHGKGEQLTKNGTLLKGHFVHGQLTGPCQGVTKNGARFAGQAKQGRLQGIFTTKYGSVIQGNFDIDNLSGPNCKKKYTNGDQYIGMVNKLKANGFGRLKFTNGNLFEGNFQRDFISEQNSGTITGKFQTQIQNGQIRIKQIQEQLQANQSDSDSSISEVRDQSYNNHRYDRTPQRSLERDIYASDRSYSESD